MLAVIFMRPVTSIFSLAIIIFSFACSFSDKDVKIENTINNDSIYNKNFIIDSVPNLKKFLALNEEEKRIDSSSKSNEPFYKQLDSVAKVDKTIDLKDLMPYRNFSTNRGRIYFSSFKEGSPNESDSSDLLTEGLPTLCVCIIQKDTIVVNIPFGLFGGGNFNLKITKSGFLSSYSQYIDNVKPFKTKVTDDFSDNFTVDNKFQFLILNKKPSIKQEEQLTGYLTFTTNHYFEDKGDKLDTNYIKGHLFFTCSTK